VRIEKDATAEALRTGKKYIGVIVTEMERRFSDDVGKVASVQEVLRQTRNGRLFRHFQNFLPA